MNSHEVEFDLMEGLERLIGLTDILNLEDYDKVSSSICQLYPFVDDFVKLRDHICEQKKIMCSYGLDSPLYDDALFRKMQVLASRLIFRSGSAVAYGCLRSILFFEVNEFFDEILLEMEIRLNSSKSEDEIERLVKSAVILREIYYIYL